MFSKYFTKKKPTVRLTPYEMGYQAYKENRSRHCTTRMSMEQLKQYVQGWDAASRQSWGDFFEPDSDLPDIVGNIAVYPMC